jgi:RimJ/RimL family protein N-acetyltransferase
MDLCSPIIENYQEYLDEVVNHYKCKSLNDYLICIPVFDSKKSIVAYLRPITVDYHKTIPSCVELMSKWRIENPTIGTGTFTVTNERTEHWLNNLVINNHNRIIFLISDFVGNHLGHIGYAAFDYDRQSAEIDSVLRGVKDIIPGLMCFCMNSMINWGKNILKLKEITLKVFSNNTHAINFYERCGFTKNILIPLIKVVLPDEEKWEVSSDPNLKKAERYYQQMIYYDPE